MRASVVCGFGFCEWTIGGQTRWCGLYMEKVMGAECWLGLVCHVSFQRGRAYNLVALGYVSRCRSSASHGNLSHDDTLRCGDDEGQIWVPVNALNFVMKYVIVTQPVPRDTGAFKTASQSWMGRFEKPYFMLKFSVSGLFDESTLNRKEDKGPMESIYWLGD